MLEIVSSIEAHFTNKFSIAHWNLYSMTPWFLKWHKSVMFVYVRIISIRLCLVCRHKSHTHSILVNKMAIVLSWLFIYLLKMVCRASIKFPLLHTGALSCWKYPYLIKYHQEICVFQYCNLPWLDTYTENGHSRLSTRTNSSDSWKWIALQSVCVHAQLVAVMFLNMDLIFLSGELMEIIHRLCRLTLKCYSRKA